jgi:hypothetical protein
MGEKLLYNTGLWARMARLLCHTCYDTWP